jgi:hypothetical protein
MPCRPLLQRVNQALIKISDHKVCHLSPLLCQLDDCNDSIPSGVILQIFLLSGSENETSLLALYLRQYSFGLRQPEGHVHGTGQINGGRQRRMRLLLLTGGL